MCEAIARLKILASWQGLRSINNSRLRMRGHGHIAVPSSTLEQDVSLILLLTLSSPSSQETEGPKSSQSVLEEMGLAWDHTHHPDKPKLLL